LPYSFSRPFANPPANPEHAALEIHVDPGAGERLLRPHPGPRHEHDKRAVGVAELGGDRVDLLPRVERMDLA